MNQKSKFHKLHHEAKMEQQAKKVINWIFGALILLAIAFMVYSMTLM